MALRSLARATMSLAAALILLSACAAPLAAEHSVTSSVGRTTASTAPLHDLKFEDATLLSPFGERAAFSPDGRRVAFVGKSYGDVFEIDLATRHVRNLTANVPNQGFLRVNYLPNGDYLLTGPRRYTGPNARVSEEMWVLDKHLQRGLQPLNEGVFEGMAVSRISNHIAWSEFDPPLSLRPEQNWLSVAFQQPMKRYVADIVYEHGVPHLANKRQIMPNRPEGCGVVEAQDFRDRDNEMIFSCGGIRPDGGYLVHVMAYKIDTGEFITYRRNMDESNEPEGIAPDGSWTTVECGTPRGPGAALIDICRLELVPGGALTRLIVATGPGSTRQVADPVVSPDGNWIAFQASDRSIGEAGEGLGIFLMRIAR